MNRLYLSPPYMTGTEQKYVQEAFETNWIAPLGPNVNAFEEEISDYIQIKGGVALSSGTAAIHLALKYFGVDSGDDVFCSTFTFSGSCNPIMYQKANPVFIESEADTWNMSSEALERAFYLAIKHNKMPKAVIIVDLYGQSANYDSLIELCSYYKVPIIEDAAEALGATYKNKKCGSFGHAGVISFNGNKIITTSGGGMLVSDDEDMLKKARFWATQSREPFSHYEHREIGYNYRMSNICAGIGRGQLEALSKFIQARKQIYLTYQAAFKGLPLSMMPIAWDGEPNYWLSVVILDEEVTLSSQDIITALEKENIESRPIWKPMHLQPVFKGCKYFDAGSPVSEDLFNRGICLPSGAGQTLEQTHKVIDILCDLFK